MTEVNKEDFLTLEQVQQLTGISEMHLDHFISNGDLQTVQINGSIYVPKTDFEVFHKSLEDGRAILYSALNDEHISLEEKTELSEDEIDELNDL